MFLWDRKTIIALVVIIIAGVYYLSGIAVPLQTNAESNIDKLANYLYSAPVIAKRIKAFFSFSEFPIMEALINGPVTFNNNAPKVPQSPRSQLLPSPTPSPIAAKPNASGDSANTAEVNTNGKPKFKVEIYNNDRKNESFATETGTVESGGMPPISPNPANTAEQKMNDWRYRLFTNPSKDNMNEFIQEYQSDKITKDIFYGVIKSLIDGSDDRAQAIAIYGLTAIRSFASYEMLVIKIDEKTLLKENQALAQKNIDSYSSPSSMNILLVALKSQNSVIILQGLHNLNRLIESNLIQPQKQELATLSDRERRGASAPTKTKKESFSNFISTLQSLTHESNSQIAQLAENTLQQFQDPDVLASSNLADSNSQPGSRVRQ